MCISSFASLMLGVLSLGVQTAEHTRPFVVSAELPRQAFIQAWPEGQTERGPQVGCVLWSRSYASGF